MTVLKVVEYTQYSAVVVVGSKRSQANVFQHYSLIVKRSSYVDNSILQIQYLGKKTNKHTRLSFKNSTRKHFPCKTRLQCMLRSSKFPKAVVHTNRSTWLNPIISVFTARVLTGTWLAGLPLIEEVRRRGFQQKAFIVILGFLIWISSDCFDGHMAP